jgi:hypothetical protein
VSVVAEYPFDESVAGPAGWLPDGTPYYAPLGQMVPDGDRVCCHLCGRWFLSVASHLRVHGWTKDGYVEAFGLESGNSLAGVATRKRRAAALAARRVVDPTLREAQSSARERARKGELTRAAAAAARGRAHPLERRPKTLAALAMARPEARAAGYARWHRERLAAIAADVAARFGFADFASYVAGRMSTGMSMAAISREAGLHKDWVCRHLAQVAAEAALAGRPDHRDQRWRPVLARLGFPDLAAYLRVRHVEQHRTIAAIAAESGTTPRAVTAAMRRHGIARTVHAGKRHAAAGRDRDAARNLGFPALDAYITARRAAGMTWKAMAAESGIPETSLRRRRPR